MPKYSLKHKNDSNAAAYRHMLGGRMDPTAGPSNQKDLRSSDLHWALGLRYYNPENDLGQRSENASVMSNHQ